MYRTSLLVHQGSWRLWTYSRDAQILAYALLINVEQQHVHDQLLRLLKRQQALSSEAWEPYICFECICGRMQAVGSSAGHM